MLERTHDNSYNRFHFVSGKGWRVKGKGPKECLGIYDLSIIGNFMVLFQIKPDMFLVLYDYYKKAKYIQISIIYNAYVCIFCCHHK